MEAGAEVTTWSSLAPGPSGAARRWTLVPSSPLLGFVNTQVLRGRRAVLSSRGPRSKDLQVDLQKCGSTNLGSVGAAPLVPVMTQEMIKKNRRCCWKRWAAVEPRPESASSPQMLKFLKLEFWLQNPNLETQNPATGFCVFWSDCEAFQ